MKHIIKRIVAPMALALGLAAAMPAAAHATAASPQPSGYGYIANRATPPGSDGHIYCLDEIDGSGGNGRYVSLRTCNNTWQQYWVWDAQGLIHSTNDGRCLWAHRPASINDNPDARAVDCNGGDANQRWTMQTNHGMCNLAGACLVNTGIAGPHDSFRLWSYPSSAGVTSPAQQFDWRPTNTHPTS